ncbi:hypothetical protein GOL96_29750 [Sinorhizobium medicae]|uniref:Pam3-gp28 family putative phage holin n=1 Tax=Rhizobium meliloti TaxID=382 RepID=UPI000FDAAE30|nr:hypothetical protein [Sinorhizobium meliloti]MDX0469729.1 hypothetical protein [Sinorhizobium medicae]MDW9855394.1 hypothetical protein [Sinorhizobium meliloti]MDW9873379.1 hypothetical protein [Sinorhizobium meliloti]MDW9885079.1 hypothetical protein [Sinorhizobium meliloti]MDX0752910.1 hypothetical protein [Sinorhizobium medicae]
MNNYGIDANLLPLLRHALQLVAGILIYKGAIDEAGAELLIGGITSLATAAWMYFTKPKAAP